MKKFSSYYFQQPATSSIFIKYSLQYIFYHTYNIFHWYAIAFHYKIAYI